MNGVTLKAVDPTAEDHLVRKPEIAAHSAPCGTMAGRIFAPFR
jgi:hypothetical protein